MENNQQQVKDLQYFKKPLLDELKNMSNSIPSSELKERFMTIDKIATEQFDNYINGLMQQAKDAAFKEGAEEQKKEDDAFLYAAVYLTSFQHLIDTFRSRELAESPYEPREKGGEDEES